MKLHDINSFFLIFVLPSSVRHSFTMASQSDFPQSFWRASVTVGNTWVPTPDQLNQNPWGWTQTEISCKNSSAGSNKLPGYKNHWLRIAKLGWMHKSRVNGVETWDLRGQGGITAEVKFFQFCSVSCPKFL